MDDTVEVKRPMKDLVKEKRNSFLYRVIGSFFKHDCDDNRKVISKSYLKDGQTGITFSLGKEFECCKCGKQWSR
tara:strand:- start:611 stop:832 length:222 start_codon:yes stop_codon:yes gene_type:complete